MARRKVLGETDQLHREPMSIYEVHLPSWMRGQDGRYLSVSLRCSVGRFPVDYCWLLLAGHWDDASVGCRRILLVQRQPESPLFSAWKFRIRFSSQATGNWLID